MSPPSFRVTTAAAVAVGHIRQSAAPSRSTLGSPAGTKTSIRDKIVKRPPWTNRSHPCQRQGLRLWGSTRRKERNSMQNMSRGWVTEMASRAKAWVGASQGMEIYAK